jgi:hypothetical protein
MILAGQKDLPLSMQFLYSESFPDDGQAELLKSCLIFIAEHRYS